MTTRVAWKPRAVVAERLLARQMWFTDQYRRGCDADQVEEEWDNDRLLTDVYQRYIARAREAIEETMARA